MAIAPSVRIPQIAALRKRPHRSTNNMEKIGCWISVLFLMALADPPRRTTDNDRRARMTNAGAVGRGFVHDDS